MSFLSSLVLKSCATHNSSFVLVRLRCCTVHIDFMTRLSTSPVEEGGLPVFRPAALFEAVSNETRSVLLRLCATWGCIISSWAVLGATVPLLLKDIVGPSDAAWWQGVFTSTTALSGALSCALLGYYSDKIGRLEMLLPWITAFFLSTICVVFAEVTRSVYLLWVARLPAIAVPSTILFAFATDLVQGSHVLEAHGLLGATFGVSLLAGSLTCGIIGYYVSRFAALCTASFFATAAAFVSATTIVAPQNVASAGVKHESFIEAVKVVRRDPLLRLIIVAFALVRVANVNSYFMFVLFTNYRLGWQTFDAAIALGLVGSLAVFWQIFGVRYIVTSHENVIPFLILTLACYPIAMVGYGLATSSAAMYAVAVFGSVAGIASSILTTKISVISAEVGISGMSLGLVGSIQNVVEVVVALAFGRLLSWSLHTYNPDDVMLGLPYFVNAGFFAMAIGMVVYAHRVYGIHRPQWVGHTDERKKYAA